MVEEMPLNTAEIDLAKMRGAADQASHFMKILANKDRLMLFCQINEGEKCVNHLQDVTGIVQPTLSQQLSILRKAGLVKTRRAGKEIHYSTDNQVAESIISILYAHYCQD
jgi:DNA-binding transcriptional ArsR family regulator